MKEKFCFIIGDKARTKELYDKLEFTIHFMLDQGFTSFYISSENLFGSLAKSILNEAKKIYPDLKIYLNITYKDSFSFIENGQEYFLPTLRWEALNKVADEFDYFMVGKCDSAITYVNDKKATKTRDIYRELLKTCQNVVEI